MLFVLFIKKNIIWWNPISMLIQWFTQDKRSPSGLAAHIHPHEMPFLSLTWLFWFFTFVFELFKKECLCARHTSFRDSIPENEACENTQDYQPHSARYRSAVAPWTVLCVVLNFHFLTRYYGCSQFDHPIFIRLRLQTCSLVWGRFNA